MEIVLTGNEKKLKKFLKSNSLFMKRNDIKVKDGKGVKEEPKLTASQIADLIAKCESIEDLKQYESDKRQVASKAYDKKLKELSE
jgi:hypothetical protein